MDEYLATTNARPGVFRDEINTAEYDPLRALQHTIRVPTGAAATAGAALRPAVGALASGSLSNQRS